jgi:hypothetical protein
LNFIQKIVEMSQIYHNSKRGNCFPLNQCFETKEHQTGRRNLLLKCYLSEVLFMCLEEDFMRNIAKNGNELLADLVEYSRENNGFCSKNEMLPGGGVHLPGGADRQQGAL